MPAEEELAAAITARLGSVVPALELDQLVGESLPPRYYELHLSRAGQGPRRAAGGSRDTLTGWRLQLRAVAKSVANVQKQCDDAYSALEDFSLAGDGWSSTPLVRPDVSERPIDAIGQTGRFQRLIELTFTT